MIGAIILIYLRIHNGVHGCFPRFEGYDTIIEEKPDNKREQRDSPRCSYWGQSPLQHRGTVPT